MEYLSRIDWHNHDGVNLSMINDFVRNQFYDQILANHVAGQDCTDIGFGTGLLSMLALKHGARHIRAFESDHDRYCLGRDIVQELGLTDRIEIVNERYDRTYAPTPVTFTETVNGNLWWEGLWNSLPIDSSQCFLPGHYFLEIWASVIPKTFAQGLCRNGARRFNPGVDVDQKFVGIINKFAGTQLAPEVVLSQGVVSFPRQNETDWGWIPYMRAVLGGQVVASYDATTYQAGLEYFELEIETQAWQDLCVLLVPRMGMKQDGRTLYLDTGHWGPGEDPVLLINPKNNIVVRHNVRDGNITYHEKE